MPKPPLIKSPGRREAVLAVVMLGVCLGSLGLAWMVTGAPLQRLSPPQPVRVSLGPAEVSLLASWEQASYTPASEQSAEHWRFAHPRLPGESLEVWLIRSAEPIDPADLLRSTASSLIEGQQQQIQQIGVQSLTTEHHRAAIYATATVVPDVEMDEQALITDHVIAVASPDGRRSCVFHFTEQVTASTWTPGRLELLRTRLRLVVDSARYDP